MSAANAVVMADPAMPVVRVREDHAKRGADDAGGNRRARVITVAIALRVVPVSFIRIIAVGIRVFDITRISAADIAWTNNDAAAHAAAMHKVAAAAMHDGMAASASVLRRRIGPGQWA